VHDAAVGHTAAGHVHDAAVGHTTVSYTLRFSIYTTTGSLESFNTRR
jgi:hypothetical protein